ncbi:TIGR03013 family XrtA/PEP-CTERM system glycosyltransferase [Thiohalorhabdus methylotrophus]|uniref:TIGR03013 family XrtA/PEP-CTERM system glycosyltransferase n=1 Tax=Thiohalorhabdus methylotrophus TaxID=3242694 RepID=A0ABV4TVE7_9GAMM
MRTIPLFQHHIKTGFLVLGLVELMVLVVSVATAAYARFQWDALAVAENAGPLLPKALFAALVLQVSMVATGLYQRHLRDGYGGISRRLLIAFMISLIFLTMAFYSLPELYLGRGILGISLVIAFPSLLATRVIFFSLMRTQGIRRRVLVLGAGQAAEVLSRFRRETDRLGKDIVGYVPMGEEAPRVEADQLVELPNGLSPYALRNVDEIVVAVDERRNVLPVRELLECRIRGIEVVDLLTFLERETGKVKVDLAQPSWFTYSPGFFYRGLFHRFFKRAIDLVGALTFLVLAAPVMAITALAIWLEDRGPIFYRQTRAGEDGRPFRLIKFRSMRTDAEKLGVPQWAAENDPRVTRVGAVIRKYRIDELPQVLNILRGDMSFVGPRPERPEFEEDLLEKLPYYAERHRVKPGLTGWAQICYPYGASREDALEKLQYDLYYVKNFSLFLDLMILIHTAEVVLWGKGAR